MLIRQSTKTESLNSVKGFASLRVLFFHLSVSFFRGTTGFDNKTGVMVFSENYPFWLYLLGEFRTGVNVFFFVSGYLIHSLYAGKIFTPHFSGYFIKKRLIRLLPPYYVSIFISVAGLLVIGGNTSFKDVLFHILCIHNFFDETSFTIQAVYWFLAVEVQIFLLYTLYRYIQENYHLSISVKDVFVVAVLLASGIKLFYYLSSQDLILLKMQAVDNVWMRFPDWLIGAVAYEYRNKLAKIRFRWLYGVLIISVSLYFSRYFVFNYFLSDLCYSFAFCFIISLITEKNLKSRLLSFIGKMSFSFYLYHFLIYSIWDVFWTKSLQLERVPGNERLFVMITAIPVTLLGSYLLYTFAELPVKKYFSRYTHKQMPAE